MNTAFFVFLHSDIFVSAVLSVSAAVTQLLYLVLYTSLLPVVACTCATCLLLPHCTRTCCLPKSVGYWFQLKKTAGLLQRISNLWRTN
jgi:hypothetical protein